MPIPDAHGGDLYTWFSRILQELSEANTKLALFRQEWGELPPKVKEKIREDVSAVIQVSVMGLEELIQEVKGIPD